MRQRILIAGCGYVGRALARELTDAGHVVTALRRGEPSRTESTDALGAAVTQARADLSDRASLLAALATTLSDGVDVVFFTAAADTHDEASYRAVYVDGLRNLVDALRSRGAAPKRLLFTSSTGVYGQDDGGVVDETSPSEPASFAGRVMCEAEAVAAQAPWPSISLRLGGIYGPQRTQLIESVRSGAARLAKETVYTNRFHRSDCAGALAHLMTLEAPHAVYNGVDAEAAPRADVLGFIARALGVPAPQPSGDSAQRQRGGNKRVSSRRLLQSGYALRYPTYREGYAELLASMTLPRDESVT